MNNNVTIHDVAKTVGVSATTVFKAINGKSRISEETRELVLQAVKEMGYKANKVAQTLKRKEIRIGVIIEKYFSGFNDEIIDGMNKAFDELSDNKFRPLYNNFNESYNEAKVVEDIYNILKQGVDAFILCLGSEKFVPIINDLYEKNIPLILIATDLNGSKKLSVIRQNASIVGRIGAQLLDWINPDGYNVVLIGNKENIAHREVIEGFKNEIETSNSKLVGIFESHDDEKIAYYLIEKIINEHPNVNGIFIGSAVTHGVCKKIKERNMAGKIKLVCTDTYPEIIKNIKDDVIQAAIFQDPFTQGKQAVRTLYRYLVEDILPQETLLINPRIVIKSNCEDF